MHTFFKDILAFIITYVLLHYLTKIRLYIKAAKFPGPPTLPFIGNAHFFIGNTEDILNKVNQLINTYASPFRVWLGDRLFYAVYDPEQLKTILTSPKTIEKEELYKLWKPWIGDGLMTAPAHKWKVHRKMIAPAFNKRLLESFVKIFSEQSNIIVKNMEIEVNGPEFDIHHYTELCTLDMICRTAMGVSSNVQTQNKLNYRKATDKLMEIIYTRVFQVWLHPDFIFNRTKLGKEMHECLDEVHGFSDQLIKQKKKELESGENSCNNDDSNETRRKAFLDLLMTLSDEGIKIKDKDLKDEFDTLLLVGHDSTAMMNCFVILVLAIYPEIQNKVYEELYSIYGSEDPNVAPVEHEDLNRMEYLERVIKETMRIFPLVPLVYRQVTEDLDIGDYTLTKGSSVALAIMKVHHHEDHWKNPMTFDPDRFLPEECAKRHPYAYIPFSGGPRNCIGVKYAMMSMKTLIATILRKYVIKKNNIVPIRDIKMKVDIALRPVEPIAIRIEKRI